jgi:Na+-transporting methylmalonyl-CoA/oxaloacetate decarboxylase gamma subunit
MKGGAGLVVLVLLFLASLGYVVFGGAVEMEPSPEAKIAIAAAAAKPADTRRSPRYEQVAGASVAATDHAPVTYADRVGDGDGNVMTYEHD